LELNPANCANTKHGNNAYTLGGASPSATDKMYAMVLTAYTLGRFIVVKEIDQENCSGGLAIVTEISLEPVRP
jgi:hypothetical protein